MKQSILERIKADLQLEKDSYLRAERNHKWHIQKVDYFKNEMKIYQKRIKSLEKQLK